MVGYAPEWEPWEARRASLPSRPAADVREAREDARLLLMVVRARGAERRPAFEHAQRLAEAAEDARLTARLRLRAATALARLRMSALGRT